MIRTVHRPRTAAILASTFLVALWAPAAAQMPTVEPDGTLADPAAPPPPEQAPAQPATPPVVVVGPDGQSRVVEPVEGEGQGGFYYSDEQQTLYPGTGPAQGPGEVTIYAQAGPVPATHAVVRGDTLWDICGFYFNNPWDWPRVWSLNPEITNPHWIYPGDQVRLRGAGDGAEEGAGELVGAAEGEAGGPEGGEPLPGEGGAERPRGWFSLRQLAFVDQEDLDYAAVVDGSTDEKLLLSEGDTIYMRYPEGKPPEVGNRYAIFAEKKTVEHPTTGKPVGAYVRVVGEVEILSVKKGKRARGVITDSADVVERGHLVGPLKRTFKDVEPTPSQVDLQGVIVAQLEADELVGARQVVFIDRGSDQGVQAGNRMYVVRRGDAYPEPGGRVSNRGLDDRRYPARAIGEVLIVQAGERTSVGLVTLSMQEFEPGDMVLMRRSGGGEE